MTLISTLRKSRLVQLVFLGSAGVLPAIILCVSTDLVFPVFVGGLLLVSMLILVTVRMVQLQWKLTTMTKSALKRRHGLELTIANTALALRREFQAEISNQNASGFVNQQRRRKAIVQPFTLIPADRPAIGRVAAAVQEAENRDTMLHEMLDLGLASGDRSRIIGIFSRELTEILSNNYEISEISPGIMREQLYETVARVLVVDQHAFRSGPWFGADTASGTTLFLLITDLIHLAKSMDIVVWFISTGEVSNPYTNEIRSICSGSFGVDARDIYWSESFHVNFVQQVNEYAAAVRIEIEQQ